MLWISLVGIYQSVKPLPEGVNYRSAPITIPQDNVKFLTDLTYIDPEGKLIHDQEIFDTMFSLIDSAEQYILIDGFLFNPYLGRMDSCYRKLTEELSKKLIDKKQSDPSIKIDLIMDPINTWYGGRILDEIDSMKVEGINVHYTDLTKLRDSNFIYSPIWRVFFQWFGNSDKIGILPNIVSPESKKISLRSYLTFLNLKVNHRKSFITFSNGKIYSIVTSANPHSASSAFSNVAILIEGEFGKELYDVERSMAEFSGFSLDGDNIIEVDTPSVISDEDDIQIEIITEGQIKKSIISLLKGANPGDSISIAMFHLSNRKVIQTILNTSKRGVSIRLILDPNKDGFGYPQNGIPNRPAAHEIIKKSNGRIKIRWYHTHGEEFHTKLLINKQSNGQSVYILGSSNITRKNIGNYNLELDVKITTTTTNNLTQELTDYFEKIWKNRDGNYYTANYEVFEDKSKFKTIIYRLQEFTGISNF
ncbi:MAG: phospholipase [Candidatus Marinimicrobia bacterium]|nr:phospholipase [Candidatus Neomarinimicrobiota bacterium]MBT3634499.1 phospholipase [Candidatus Neomarinimicrobiota bacterium]MBT4173425.1 phospholipase [Candidatus Neomarinimicrobiota bacterium]MBT7021233.1 phospholipase [Candidatus Neomarinimicrobiota bacterium]MBT7884153.1 phospholipase [Candidatus Neomarinimicrobiota bacterium]